MKLVLLILCVSLSVVYADPPENKYHIMGKVKVTKNSPAYPVLEYIKAFKKKDVEKAKTFCTKEFIKHRDKYTLGFAKTGLETFNKKYDDTKPLKFKIYTKDNKKKVSTAFKSTESGSVSATFHVEKINGKWLIIPIIMK